MTLEELDQKLASWTTDLDQLQRSLDRIEGGVAYQSAKGVQLVDTTKKKVDEAFAKVEKLFEWKKLLQDMLDGAKKKRQDDMPSIPLMRGSHIAEIEQMLTGESIVIGSTAANSADPFAGGPTKNRITPDALKKRIGELFGEADKVFNDFRDRRLALDARYNPLAEKVADFRKRVEALGKPMPSEIPDCEMRLRTVDKKRSFDPLSITADWITEQLGAYVDKAEVKVQAFEHELESVANDVKKAAARLEQIRTLRGQVVEAGNRAGELVKQELVKVPPKTQELGDKLALLQKAVDEKRYLDAQNGLLVWYREASALEAACNSALQANRDLLSRRQGLLTRLSAAKQKHEQNKDKELDDDKALGKFLAKAEQLLNTKPLDVDAAETAVYSYETRLGELIAAWGNRPPPTREETLSKRLARARASAQEAGVQDSKALTAFGRKADEALAAKDLDTADSMIYSFETKVEELKARATTGSTTPANPGKETKSTTVSDPPAPAPATARSRKDELSERLANAEKKAQTAGLSADKVLPKFAAKAKQHLESGNLDEAESMIYSFETRLGELTAAR